VTDQHDNTPPADPRDEVRIPVAIALKHERATDRAPRVVATGRGAIAERILELAFSSGVKVREDADLVEVLAALDADEDIPVAAFAAVAEILSYVYRANADEAPADVEGRTAP
jgi:flagellar biosynthesis protein